MSAYAFLPAPGCPPQTAQFRTHQRRCVLLLFNRHCLFAWKVVPRSNFLLRSQGGPFRPRPGRPSVHPQRRSLPLFQGARGLPSTALQSPPSPRFQTASPATLHCVPRPWSLGDSETGIRIEVSADANGITRTTVPPQRLPATKANQGDHARASVLIPASCPARRTVRTIYFYHKGAAADAAACFAFVSIPL